MILEKNSNIKNFKNWTWYSGRSGKWTWKPRKVRKKNIFVNYPIFLFKVLRSWVEITHSPSPPHYLVNLAPWTAGVFSKGVAGVLFPRGGIGPLQGHNPHNLYKLTDLGNYLSRCKVYIPLNVEGHDEFLIYVLGFPKCGLLVYTFKLSEMLRNMFTFKFFLRAWFKKLFWLIVNQK